MTAFTRHPGVFCAFALLPLALAGCALRPAGEKAERERLRQEGAAYEKRPPLPELAESPAVEDYLHHAFLNNADLEARYWQWRSAVERIPQVSSFPRIGIGFDVMFTRENMSLWNRTTLSAATDSMENVPFPTKLRKRGQIALAEARAAAARFEEAKFFLQRQVRDLYYDLALVGESLRIQEENILLLRMTAEQAAVRVAAGAASQEDLLRAQTALDLALNDLENLRAQVPPLTARMNAALGRPADAPVPVPKALPDPRPLPAADADLLRIGAERSPELEALARETAGRKDALALAKQAWLPDFGFGAALTGDMSRAVGGMIMLPTQVESIKAGIAQARANLQAAEAARAQYARDLAASFVLNLFVLRNDERQVELFEQTVIPRAEQTVAVAASAYANGRLPFGDFLDAQRALLDARLVTAQLRTEREKALTAIETWAAVDVQAMPRAGMASPRGGGGTSAPPVGGAGARGGMSGMGGM